MANSITICVGTFEEWREFARILLQKRIAIDQVIWVDANEPTQNTDLFSDARCCLSLDDCRALNSGKAIGESIVIPKNFFTLAKNVACFRDVQRWSLLYSLAWRLVFENKYLLADRTDPSVARAHKMQKIIARDKHKMEAFVRFKRMQISEDTSDEYYVAWFEPEHYIVRDKASFFVKRFQNMRWSILTPLTCMHWDGFDLNFTEGVARPPTTEDAMDALWLTYYKNIFNPARLKISAMQAEMPKKYWKNLPEAELISDLVRGAAGKMEHMVSNGGKGDNEKASKSRAVEQARKSLRNRF